jgi:hypothetical protein
MQIDLEPTEYRAVHHGPLANPKELRRALVIMAAGTVLCAYAAWQFGTFWSAFLPVPCAIWAGVAFAGLNPAWCFHQSD